MFMYVQKGSLKLLSQEKLFQKENAELNGDSFHDPDDPFGENADHDKLLAIAKQFEAKYVSYRFLKIQPTIVDKISNESISLSICYDVLLTSLLDH